MAKPKAFDPLVGKPLYHGHDYADVEGVTDALDPRYVNVTGDNLDGNLTCDAGVLIDGYDISVEFASIDEGIDGGTF